MPRKRRSQQAPKLYAELADWFHLLTAPRDYAKEARLYRRTLTEACERRPRTVLELGSGGGNNASHLKKHFTMTLTDLSPDMLKLSQTINPECEHIQGDMRSVRLDREFDAVFVHDAVAYLTKERDLARAIATAFVHCRPGGAALFVPDAVRETFKPSTTSGGHDGDDGRALRYLQWIWDPDPRDTTYVGDMAYLLRDRNGRISVEHDRHLAGLFPRRTWLQLLRKIGFRVSVVKPPKNSHPADYPPELYVGRKPGR
jgi:SAM-dependent methyltransferase